MIKDLDYYMKLPYNIVIEQSPEGGYVGWIPDLKGCITQAETREEIMLMIDDAKKCWLEVALEDGEAIPEPQSETTFTGKFNLSIPKSLHRRLAMTAEDEGVSLNQLAIYLLADGLKARMA